MWLVGHKQVLGPLLSDRNLPRVTLFPVSGMNDNYLVTSGILTLMVVAIVSAIPLHTAGAGESHVVPPSPRLFYSCYWSPSGAVL